MALAGKRVLMRIDANVPVKHGEVVEGPHGKIARAAVDIEWLRQRGARVVIVTHLGRPNGKRVNAYSVRPVARRLSELLGVEVPLAKDVVGPSAARLVAAMHDGDVVLLENIRFHAGEERNSTTLAHALAQLGDLYVNDAFAVSHRAHASVDAITSELPSFAGPQLVQEATVMGKVVKVPKHPFVVVMGGLKMDTKLPVLKRLLPEADLIIVGGALATAFFLADGLEVGKSTFDPDGVQVAKGLLRRWRSKIILPLDVVVTRSLRGSSPSRHIPLSEVGPQDQIVDVGRRSIRLFAREIQDAKTIVWNGPIGYCERPAFSHGTQLLARAIAHRTGKAVTVVGGGDTIPAVEAAGVADQFTLLSTGGGAMLEFLSGKKLPGLEALEV